MIVDSSNCATTTHIAVESEMPQTVALSSCRASYVGHVNPQWVRLLDLLQMNVEYEYCRGAELFCRIEFRAPKRLSLRIPFEAFRKIHPGLFGQSLVSKLFNDAGVLTQICGNNFMVLKVAPR